MKKDPNKIPKGMYCKGCPYWSIDPNLPEQENGCCAYLETNDYKRNEEIGDLHWRSGKTGEITMVTGPHEMPVSLLWDGCKECRINEDFEEEE